MKNLKLFLSTKKIFIFWILLLPFVRLGFVYEGAKVVYFLVGSFVLFLIWILFGSEKIGSRLNKTDYIYFVWLAVLVLSSILGVHPIDSILGGSYRHQGVLFFLSLWLIGKTIGILDKKENQLLIWGLSLSVLLEIVFVFGQKLLNYDLVNGRPLGSLGEPNAVAGFIVLTFPFLMQNLLKLGFSQKVRFPILIIVLLALIVCGSRLALIIYIFEVIYFLFQEQDKVLKYSFLVGIVLASFLSVYRNYQIRPVGFYKTQDYVNGLIQFQDRFYYWQLAFEKVKERPFLGYGAESGETIFDQAFAEKQIPLSNLMVDRAHNVFLDVALWSGITGLIFFVVWLFIQLKWLIKRKYSLQIIVLAAFLIYSFFQPLSVVHWLMLYLIFNFQTGTISN